MDDPQREQKSLTGIAEMLLPQFGELFRKATEIAVRQGLNHWDAEDVATRAVANLWRRSTESQILHISAYLHAAVKNYVADSRRNRKSTQRLHIENAAANVNTRDTRHTDEELVQALQEELRKLSNQERVIVDLHFVRSIPYKTISQLTGIAEHALRSDSVRVMRLLRSRLLERFEDEVF